MLIKEIMTRDVITIDADKSVLDACLKYKERKIGCLLVVKNKSLVGIVTERDLIERAVCERLNLEKTKISQIMSSDIIRISALKKLDDAIDIMKEFDIKKLPVFIDDRLVGIVTITDIYKAKPDLSQRFIKSWVSADWRD